MRIRFDWVGQLRLLNNTSAPFLPTLLGMDGMNLLKQKGKVGMICIWFVAAKR